MFILVDNLSWRAPSWHAHMNSIHHCCHHPCYGGIITEPGKELVPVFSSLFMPRVTRVKPSSAWCHVFLLAKSQMKVCFSLCLVRIEPVVWSRTASLENFLKGKKKKKTVSNLCYSSGAKNKKSGFTSLVLDSLDEQTLAKPKGHVDHMALHSLMACTTQRRTFMAATRTGTN